MSATVDEKRREDAHEERNLRSKARLQKALAIQRAAYEGRPQAQVARELGVSREWLELVERLFGMRPLRPQRKQLAREVRRVCACEEASHGSV